MGQQQIAGYINGMVDHGVVGIRIDAAKHQDAGEMSGITKRLPGSLYINQEVIGSDGEAVQPSEYFDIGHVTEFYYADYLDGNIIPENSMTNLQSFGESWGLMPSDKACAFLDNHDPQRNGRAQLTYKNGALYTFANMFMLAWPYGDVRVMSSYYFTDTDAGPPGVGVEGGKYCADGVNWVCEHREAGVANMVKWRGVAGDAPVSNWQSGSGNQIAFSRGEAFIAMNRGSSEWTVTLNTGLSSGEYCDVVASLDNDDVATCATTVVVQSDGSASITVPPLYAVALHSGAKK